jgi:hypothetical protein
MNRTLTGCSLTLLLGLLLAVPAFAADVECDAKETLLACWERNQPTEQQREEASKVSAAEDAKDEKAKLLGKPTGVDTTGINLGSTTTDFLPMLAVSGLLGAVEKGQGEGTLVLDLNRILTGSDEDQPLKLQLALNTSPSVSTGVSGQLEAAGLDEEQRKEVVEVLEKQLTDLDDATVSLTYNRTGGGLGRTFGRFRRIFASLALAASLGEGAPAEEGALVAFGNLVEANPAFAQLGDDPLAVTFEEAREKLGPGLYQTFKEAFEAVVAEEADLLTKARQAREEAGLYRFADLIDNQSQLTFSLTGRFRDPTVGGDEVSGKLTFEKGLTSLNRVLNGMDESCRAVLDRDQPTPLGQTARSQLAHCLEEYTHNLPKSSETAPRLTFSAEWVDLDGATVDLPSGTAVPSVELPGATKKIFSLGFSRSFLPGIAGKEPLRLDVIGSYEDVSDDPMRQDRGLLTVTLSRQFGEITIPFGIVYANHSEFLTDVDDQIGAHLGIKFNFNMSGDS